MRVHIWLSASLLPAGLVAQVTAPGAHWGTSLYPARHAEERFAVEFHRFTQFSSSGSEHPSGIQETSGFNLAKLSITRELMLDFETRLTWTLEGGVGFTADQPTETLQNNYLHQLRDLNFVPVGGTRNETEFVGGGALNYWIGEAEPDDPAASGSMSEDAEEELYCDGFVGVGLGTGTIYHESFLHLGGAAFVPDWNVRFSYYGRMAWVDNAEAYARVAHFGTISQFGVAYVPDGWYLSPDGEFLEYWDRVLELENLWPWRWPSTLHTVLGRPEVGIYATFDSGFFVEPSGDPIDTRFLSLRFDWPTGMRMETWNDFANGTDFGPSFGLLLSFDLATFFARTR